MNKSKKKDLRCKTIGNSYCSTIFRLANNGNITGCIMPLYNAPDFLTSDAFLMCFSVVDLICRRVKKHGLIEEWLLYNNLNMVQLQYVQSIVWRFNDLNYSKK